ncbi:MAG: hypothetical protein WDN72_00590 [Alphaproteobacteria bacterium]
MPSGAPPPDAPTPSSPPSAITGCNGNGDGQISYWYTDGARAWWMMQQAGYLEGSVGRRADIDDAGAGRERAASKVNGGGYAIGWVLVSSWLGWGTYKRIRPLDHRRQPEYRGRQRPGLSAFLAGERGQPRFQAGRRHARHPAR